VVAATLFDNLPNWVFQADAHAGTWTLLTTGIILVTAIVAFRQLREARVLRKEQTRPFVSIEFDTGSTWLIYVVIRNLGKTMARDIHMTVDPPLVSAMETADGAKTMDHQMFTTGIANLPPQGQRRFLFDAWTVRGEDRAKYPDLHTVTVTYRSHDRKDTYSDEIALDLGDYRNTRYVTRNGLHEIHGELERMRKAVESFKADFWGGVRVMTPKDIAAAEAKQNREIKRQFAAQAKKSSAGSPSGVRARSTGGKTSRASRSVE
jgi:hypothetical protein